MDAIIYHKMEMWNYICDMTDIVSTRPLLIAYIEKIPNENYETLLTCFKVHQNILKKKITVNAIKMAEKILKDTGIYCFPVIFTSASKSNSVSNGTFCWIIYKLSGLTLGSFDKSSCCLKKNVKLSIDIDKTILTAELNDSSTKF